MGTKSNAITLDSLQIKNYLLKKRAWKDAAFWPVDKAEGNTYFPWYSKPSTGHKEQFHHSRCLFFNEQYLICREYSLRTFDLPPFSQKEFTSKSMNSNAFYKYTFWNKIIVTCMNSGYKYTSSCELCSIPAVCGNHPLLCYRPTLGLQSVTAV